MGNTQIGGKNIRWNAKKTDEFGKRFENSSCKNTDSLEKHVKNLLDSGNLDNIILAIALQSKLPLEEFCRQMVGIVIPRYGDSYTKWFVKDDVLFAFNTRFTIWNASLEIEHVINI